MKYHMIDTNVMIKIGKIFCKIEIWSDYLDKVFEEFI